MTARRKARPAHRPTKFNAETAKNICALIAGGTPRRFAAQACGIGASTLKTWMNTRPAFRAQVKKADGIFVGNAMGTLRAAGKLDPVRGWQGTAWMLERKWPRHFGPTQRQLIGVMPMGPGASGPPKYLEAIAAALGVRLDAPAAPEPPAPRILESAFAPDPPPEDDVLPALPDPPPEPPPPAPAARPGLSVSSAPRLFGGLPPGEWRQR